MKKRLGSVPKGLEWISQDVSSKPTMAAIKTEEINIPAAKRGLHEDLTRATFIMRQEHLEKIKAYAYWERLQIKDVLDEMCEHFFQRKKVRSIPGKNK